MSQSLFYKAFGLVIASELMITNLAETYEQSIDVEIALVGRDHDFEDTRLDCRFANWKAGANCFLLSVDGVAEFFIKDGRRIEIKPSSNVTEETLTAFLMGSAFATLLQQRRLLTLHASAVQGSNGAILFVGRSGVGKSTAMAAMRSRGFSMVTDDVAAIDFRPEERPTIRTSFSGARLTARSLETLGESIHDYRKLNSEIIKYAFPAETADVSEMEIDRIIILDSNPRPEIEILPASHAEAFELLSFFTFRKRFYDGMKMQAFHFEAVSKLAGQTPVLKALRPDHPILLDELIETVLRELDSPFAAQARDRKDLNMTFVWLASYPKSGNTWLRILLSNYLTETGDGWDWQAPMIGPPSHLERHGFDESMGVASADLPVALLERFRRNLHEQFVRKFLGVSFAKTHEAYYSSQDGQPLYPAHRNCKVIYLVRNPLDIAASYAHHEGCSIDKAIGRMADRTSRNRYGEAFFDEHLGSWSDHVGGWIGQSDFETLIIRYEDLARDTHAALAKVIAFCRLEENAGKIDRAVAASQFARLQAMEREHGFKALFDPSRAFFRSGRTQGWHTELNALQVDKIIAGHRVWMERLSYREPDAA